MSHVTLRRLVASIVCLLALATLMPAAAGAAGMATGTAKWATYQDPRFDFSVRFPAAWHVTPRDDRPGFIGGVLTFSEISPFVRNRAAHDSSPTVEIGFYPTEIQPWQDLGRWTDIHAAADPALAGGAEIYAVTSFGAAELGTLHGQTDGRGAIFRSGRSWETEFAYVTIPRGNMVWFVWTNNLRASNLDTFFQMVKSLRFGAGAPRELRQAYGKGFEPLPLEALEAEAAYLAAGGSSVAGGGAQAVNTYRAPVSSSFSILCGNLNAELCNGTHKGGDAYALDISATYNTSVYNAERSQKTTGTYSGGGYGVYVIYTDASAQKAYYAHLLSYQDNPSTTWINRGTLIAYSGNSGGVGAHLHFAVRTSGNAAINLGSVCGISLNGSYRYCGYTTCPGTTFQCTCGSANGSGC